MTFCVTPTHRFAFIVGFLCAVKLGVVKDCCLWGQEAEPAAIQFQRIEIPEGRIDDIGGELIPSDRDEFQRTVNELNAKYRALHGLAKPSLVAARYTATFQNGQFVDGSAELDIKHPHPEPAYLSLSSLGLAAENFRWKSNPSVTPEAGLLPSGETGVLVSKSDTLTFRWSLRATSDTDRGLQFQLSLPDATTSELILDFPIGLGPECVDAIITPIPGDSEAARDIVAKARWRVELGATHRTEVNVRPTPQEGGDAHLVMVRPTFDYRISTTGLEFRAILEIDLQRRPLRNLTMQVDPRLRIGTISLNGLPVSFAANASMPDQILIELPTLAAAGPNELSATGYAETRLDGLWRLPQVQLLDVLWRQGNATIDVVEPLQIGQFDLHDCALRGVEPLPSPAVGESRRLTLLSPDATCDLLLTRQTPKLRADLGTTITLKESIISAQSIAEVSAIYGPVFSILLQRDVGWIVDSIETQPTRIEHVEVIRGTRGLSRKIILKEPITLQNPLRLIVKTHRRMPSSGTLSGLEMRPVSLSGDVAETRLIAVRTELPLQLDVLGDASVTRITEATLTSAEKSLIAGDGSPLVFRDDPQADRIRVALRSQVPRFAGEIVVDAMVEAKTMKQVFLFQCMPLSTRVGSLRVRFSPAPSESIQWSAIGDGAGGVTPVKLDEQGNEWELRLRRPRSVPFEIRAKLTRQANGKSGDPSRSEAIILASLPDAETQVGTVNVGTPDGSDFTLQNAGLRAIPAPIEDADRLPTLRATYRYAPAQDVTLELLRDVPPIDLPDAWIWNAEIASRIEINGDITHAALLRIENTGAPHFSIKLPEGTSLDRIEVDGVRVAGGGGTVNHTIPLPPSQHFPTVELRYRQMGMVVGNYRRERIVLPEWNLRCLNQAWHVWIPPDYQLATGVDWWDFAHANSDEAKSFNWEQRLFGVEVLRRSGTPWRFSSFLHETREDDHSSRERRILAQVEGILGALDAALGRDREDTAAALNWHTAISQATSGEDLEQTPIYIDCEALTESGVSPDTLLSPQATSATGALRLSDLVFVGNDNSLILTSFSAQAAGDFGACQELAERVFYSSEGELPRASRYVLIRDWSREADLYTSAWKDAEAIRDFTPLVGWTNIRLPAENGECQIILLSSTMLEAASQAIMFMAIACGFWTGRRNATVLHALLLIAVIFALVVPATIILFARSAFLGLLAAVVLVGLRRQMPTNALARNPDDSMSFRVSHRKESVTTGLWLIAIVFFFAVGRGGFAQERPAAATSEIAKVFRVYDPVDADGQPAGSRFYVSRAFFDAIESLKTTLGTQRFGAVLTSARYSLAVPETPMSAMLPELAAEFEIVSPADGPSEIRLPFVRDELQLVDATFDGQRVYPHWSADGESLEVRAEMLGQHKLRLIFRPVLIPKAEKTSFDLRIPSIFDSRLTITGRDAALIEPTSALGSIIRTDESVEVELGPTEQLSVQWSVSDLMSSKPPEYTVSQLMWMRAEARAITFETQFVFSVLSGTLAEVELLVDPRLQLLVSDTQDQVFDSLTPDNSLRRIRYQFEKVYNANEIVTIRPTFVMAELPKDGVVTRPLIKLSSRVIDNPLLAVSASAGISAVLTHADDWPSLQPRIFAEAWGTMQSPGEVVQLPTNESDWSLTVTPLVPRLQGNDVTELRIRRQQALVSYAAQAEVQDGPVFQLVLNVPREMTIDKVSVFQDDVDLVRRYSKSSTGATTLFLVAPAIGELQVNLAGTQPVPTKGEFVFAGIQLASPEKMEHRLVVLRRADVLVKAASNAGNSGSEGPSVDLQELHAGERVVGIYDISNRNEATTSQFKLNIAPNPAKFSGRLTTKLRSEGSQWSVDGDVSLQVAQGVLDSVRVRLPRELTASLKLEPPYPFKLLDVPGQSEPNLVITPPAAIDKTFQVELHASLQTSSDGSIIAPPIEVLDSPQVERLLVLPKRSAEQEIEWDIRGLEQPESDELQTTYRVRGRRMRAAVREVNQSAGSSRLLLADIEVAWQSDARYFGSVMFDLDPGALTACGLVVPPSVEVLHVSVDDVPALLQESETNAPSFLLGAERLTQRITILFRGHAVPLTTEPTSLTIATPSLRGFEPVTTLWSVHDPSSETSVPLLDHAIIDAVGTKKVRSEVIQQILSYNAGPVPQHRSNDLQHWQERWQERLAAANFNPVHENPPIAASFTSSPLANKWRHANSGRDRWTYCLFDGATSSLTILRSNRNATDWPIRFAIAMAVGGFGWFVWRVREYDRVRDVFSRWPQLPGVVFGIICWLWLTPSVVGWLIVAAFVLSSMRPSFRSRAAR